MHKLGTLKHRFIDPLGDECFVVPPVPAVAAPVKASGAVVFSSLTPHLTGPNTTDAVRKAYILQYSHAGSMILEGDPKKGPPARRVPANDPSRQFPVLRTGRAV